MSAQVQKMAQELAEYKAESTELRNQDGTIKRLEEKVRSLEAAGAEKVILQHPQKLAQKAAGMQQYCNLLPLGPLWDL